MQISDLRIYKININKKPLLEKKNKKQETNDSALIEVYTTEGIKGYGAAHHPIPGREFCIETLRFLRNIKPAIIGMDPFDIEGIHELLNKKIPEHKTAARSAIDIASHDIMGKTKNKPIYQLLSGKKEPYMAPTVMGVYQSNSMEKRIEQVKWITEELVPKGLKILQVHVAGKPKQDKKLIAVATKIFPGKIMIQAGRAHFSDSKTTTDFLNELHNQFKEKITLATFPCPPAYPHFDLSDMKYISDNSKIPVFAHYCKTIKIVKEIIELEAAKGFWVHTYLMGGFHKCTKIANLIRKNKLGLYIGNGGTEGITITAGAHLAAGTPNVIMSDCADDLKNPHLHIVTDETLPELRDGARIPSQRPGLGIKLKNWVKLQLNKTIKREG